jgi:DNA-binding LacI/PurR family transcriptional regulator
MPTDTLQTRPKMRYVCDELEKMADTLGPDAQLPTMVQLRDSLGVSMKTLHDSLREMEKRNILRSIHGVGIFVENQQKRTATGNIGFMVAAKMTSVQNLSFFGMIIAGLRGEASLHKQDVILIDNESPYANWDKLDGIVISEANNPRDPFPPLQTIPKDLPAIAILRQLADRPSIMVDDFQGTYRMTQHLLALGHRRIAYLATRGADPILRQRYEGYAAAMTEAGIEIAPRWLRQLHLREEWYNTNDWYFLAGEYFTSRWLEEDWHELGCTALIAQNDETAYGALSAFRRASIAVPEQVSIAGFDGIPRTDSLLPTLTTVRAPLIEIGQTAVTLLNNWITNPKLRPQNVRLPVKLIEGATSAPPPA